MGQWLAALKTCHEVVGQGTSPATCTQGLSPLYHLPVSVSPFPTYIPAFPSDLLLLYAHYSGLWIYGKKLKKKKKNDMRPFARVPHYCLAILFHAPNISDATCRSNTTEIITYL